MAVILFSSISTPYAFSEPLKKLSVATICDGVVLKGIIKNADFLSTKVFVINSQGSIADTKESKGGEFYVHNFKNYAKIKIIVQNYESYERELKCDSKISNSKQIKSDLKNASTQRKKIQPKVNIVGILEGRMPNQYIVGFDICAGSDRLERPQLQIITDIQDFKPFTFPSIVGSKSCKFYDYTVKANDPASIKIDFYKSEDSAKITKLEKELEELKKLIKNSVK